MAKPRKPKIPIGVWIDDKGVMHFPPYVVADPDDLSEQSLKEWVTRADQAYFRHMAKYYKFVRAYDAWWCAEYPELAAERDAKIAKRNRRA